LKVLLLASAASRQQIEPIFSELETFCKLKMDWLTPARQQKLASVVDGVPLARYDRILMWLPFDCLYSQINTLRKIPQLIVFDYTYHEYHARDREVASRRDKLTKALPWARFVVFGLDRKERLSKSGVDVESIPPFLGLSLASKEGSSLLPVSEFKCKTIGVCLLGDMEQTTNKRHREILFEIRRELKIHVIGGDESVNQKRQVLDKSVMCVVDDLPYGGLRGQSLDAFAAGCVVLLWPPNALECGELGLVDMENVALVDSKESLVAKVNFLKRHKDQAQAIAIAGQAWVAALDAKVIGALMNCIEAKLGKYTGDNAWSSLKYLFYR